MTQISEQADAKLLDALETKVGRLAASWRGAGIDGNREKSETVARQYQAVLLCMLELGFTEPLDADAELPDELMPSEYLALHGRL